MLLLLPPKQKRPDGGLPRLRCRRRVGAEDDERGHHDHEGNGGRRQQGEWRERISISPVVLGLSEARWMIGDLHL